MPVRVYIPEPSPPRRRRHRFPFGAIAALRPGAAAFVSSGPGGVVVSAADATGGAAPYTYRWQRNANGGAYSNLSDGGGVSGATTRDLTDGSAAAGTLYGYRLVYTDSAANTATSVAATAQLYTGGPLGAGAGRRPRAAYRGV